MKSKYYLAIVLDKSSRDLLLSVVRPAYERVIAHHVTVEFNFDELPVASNLPELGSSVQLEVYAVGQTPAAQAAFIKLLTADHPTRRADGNLYHCTISVPVDSSPKRSNEIKERDMQTLTPRLVLSGKLTRLRK